MTLGELESIVTKLVQLDEIPLGTPVTIEGDFGYKLLGQAIYTEDLSVPTLLLVPEEYK
jgi:hypothetical protein